MNVLSTLYKKVVSDTSIVPPSKYSEQLRKFSQQINDLQKEILYLTYLDGHSSSTITAEELSKTQNSTLFRTTSDSFKDLLEQNISSDDYEAGDKTRKVNIDVLKKTLGDSLGESLGDFLGESLEYPESEVYTSDDVVKVLIKEQK